MDGMDIVHMKEKDGYGWMDGNMEWIWTDGWILNLLLFSSLLFSNLRCTYLKS